MKFNSIVLILLSFILNSVLFAQTISIKGNVKNNKGEPIEFATVQLFSDSIYHQNALSDSLGNYVINISKKGVGELIVNFISYTTSRTQIIVNKDTVINVVIQPDTTSLKVVTIIGQNDLIQAKADRYIVKIAGNIDTKGKETTDILKQLPTINASNDALNIYGKQSVIVFINNRVIRLSGQALLSYLNSLPPDIISSVEIISTPPSEYDASGNVGIIKIVTTKNIFPGWKEFFKVGSIKNSYLSYMASALVNYNGKKIYIEGNLTHGIFSYLNQNSYYNYFPTETTTTFNPKKWTNNNTNIQTNFGYNFNSKSNIIIDFQAPLYNKEIVSDIKNQTRFINVANGITDSIVLSNGKAINRDNTINTEVFFKHTFPNNNSYFTISTAYLNNHTQSTKTFVSDIQKGNLTTTTEDYQTNGDLSYNIFTPKADFSFPFLKFTINSGLKLSLVKIAATSNFYNVINEVNTLNTLFSNKFSYTENIKALYFSLDRNFNKWSVKSGIRTEITNTLGSSLISNQVYRKNYINFFPTIYISNKINANSSITFSFANRIERPPYQYLNPFRWYINKYEYAVGNPFLTPSYISSVELSYFYNYTFSSKLYFIHQDNMIGRYVVLDSLRIINQAQKADNFLNTSTYGVNMYKVFNFAKKIEINLQGDFSYCEYKSNKSEFLNTNGINGIISINNTYKIKKSFRLICNAEEGLPGVYNYRNRRNYFKMDIGINYAYPKRNLSIKLIIEDVFKTANPEYYYISGGIKQVYNNYYDNRLLKLVLTCRPGNWFNKSSNIDTPSNYEEKNRL